MAAMNRSNHRVSYFPKVDAAVLRSKHETTPTPDRPQTVGPIFDAPYAQCPILPWSMGVAESVYPHKADEYAEACIPPRPDEFSDQYLHPSLTKNERLRLTVLWYYTRDILQDSELLSRLQAKTHLAQETIEWEFAIVGLLGINTYTRLATVGLPLAILPRRESTCAHTVNQPAGSVFLLPNMTNDWRFQHSPHVESGGLRSYAGVPLRFETESGENVALGSLCVASNTSQPILSRQQQISLVRLADWIIADIVQSARVRRQRDRRRMVELISEAQRAMTAEASDDAIMDVLRATYPDATISLQCGQSSQIAIQGLAPIPYSELENGLWENVEYIDHFIENLNHEELAATEVVRVIAARCDGPSTPSFLVIASKDFRHVFDDVDAWFVQACAGLLSHAWHRRLLSEANKEKERFLRGMTHQLRTPIHGILGSVEMLAEELRSRQLLVGAESPGPSGSSNPLTYIDTIKAAGQDLISIVNNSITLNQWADVASTKRVDTLHALDGLEKELYHAIAMKSSVQSRSKPSIFLDFKAQSNSDGVCIDLRLLKECLLPLINNAIQNTPRGIVMVTAVLNPDQKELVVDIEDDGCGIHLDDQQRIFKAYEKVDSHSTGAGLGLTLACKFASLLGGSVALVSSNVDQGSHFRATFHQVTCACLYPRTKPLKAGLVALPTGFYKMAANSNQHLLSDCLGKILTHHEFSSSDDISGSISLLDLAPNMEQHRRDLACLPSDQIAICLIPASESEPEKEDRLENVIYVRGPFMTSTWTAALDQADHTLAKILSTKVPEALPAELCTSDTIAEARGGAKTIKDVSQRDGLLTVPLLLGAAEPPTPDILASNPPVIASVDTLRSTSLSVRLRQTSICKPRLLLVDDNAINLRILKMYCVRRGLPHHCVNNGLEAVEMYCEQQELAADGGETGFGLILMDLQMPVCDGIEATRRIRLLEKERNWRPSALFMVTGQDTLADRTAAEDAGADDYFVKPVGLKLLDDSIQRYFPGFDGK